MIHPIIPHLWVHSQARQAASFYTSIFPNSAISHITTVPDTPSGNCDTVGFTINGHSLVAMDGNPGYAMTPSTSFMITFDASRIDDLTQLWSDLSANSKVLMPLGKYPFSSLYGWVEDQFGVSWQLMLMSETSPSRPYLMPMLLFTGANAGHAESAIRKYTSTIPNSSIGSILRYGADATPNPEGTIMFGDFNLNGQWFAAMDSAHPHAFTFTEAVSFHIGCDTQDEIDLLWDHLAPSPDSGHCGWVNDQFGVAWQITPTAIGKWLSQGTPEQIQRTMTTMMAMKKLNIAHLESSR